MNLPDDARTDVAEPPVCTFCGSGALHRIASDLPHPRVASHPRVDLHECASCGSLVTWPVPSGESLARLYAAFDDGIDPALRRLREETPLSAWYTRAARRAARAAGRSRDESFTWIDVGAGAGEIGAALNREFPNARGVSVDWHGRPPHLGTDARHDWIQTDLNAPTFPAAIGVQADVVISLAVIEHVRSPASFVRGLTALVRPGGTLYVMCPDYGSLAARVLGRRWPFWIPGEHLHVPTRLGILRCIERAADANRIAGRTRVGEVGLPYPLSYVVGFLGWPALARALRPIPAIPLPVGTLEASFTVRDRA
ncbi:MAG: methyltransferase domain-containing protein [Gemmatimonadetes bacterium]|nr:methyltransferase domain-containing protein [Gemmatimonadota bacterium]